jgi:YfiH family protein
MIVLGSHSQEGSKTDADGLVGNKYNQNLWVYTADCMPIFFADKRTRNVAALHCGRKGLEKKIIKNLVKIFDNFGTSKDDLLVAIGPAISKEHYFVDKMTLKEFYRKAKNKNITINLSKTEKDPCLIDSNHLKEQNLNQLDLKRFAYRQLLNENIPKSNIDISNLCTYKLKNEFNSWRRSETISRQWNVICS